MGTKLLVLFVLSLLFWIVLGLFIASFFNWFLNSLDLELSLRIAGFIGIIYFFVGLLYLTLKDKPDKIR